jgi:hypothetical protein
MPPDAFQDGFTTDIMIRRHNILFFPEMDEREAQRYKSI